MPVKPKFLGLSKNGIYVIKQYKNTHTKFKSSMLIFGCALVKKTGKCDYATFLYAMFGNLIIVRFFEIPRQNWTRWAYF